VFVFYLYGYPQEYYTLESLFLVSSQKCYCWQCIGWEDCTKCSNTCTSYLIHAFAQQCDVYTYVSAIDVAADIQTSYLADCSLRLIYSA